MTFSLHQGGVIMSGQIMHTRLYNIHPLAHMLGTCAFIFSSRALFTVYLNCIIVCISPLSRLNHQSEGGWSEGRRNLANWLHITQSSACAPGLSTPSYFLCIGMYPPPSSSCCTRPPSYHPYNLTLVYPVLDLHVLLPSTPF